MDLSPGMDTVPFRFSERRAVAGRAVEACDMADKLYDWNLTMPAPSNTGFLCGHPRVSVSYQ